MFSFARKQSKLPRFASLGHQEFILTALISLNLLVAVMLVTGCKNEDSGQKPTYPAGESIVADEIPKSQPVVVLADMGIYLLNVPATLHFAAWEDGTVLKKEGASLMIGWVPASQIASLLRELTDAGVFDRAIMDSFGVVDGPEWSMCVCDRGQCRTLNNDPQTTNDTAEYRRFKRVWDLSLNHIGRLSPTRTRHYGRPIEVRKVVRQTC